MNNMRIKEDDLTVIKEAFRKYFGDSDHLWLFGSRANPKKKGGDLDFYIETSESDVSLAVKKKMDFINTLCCTLGDQKIDVVLHILSLSDDLPIYQIAKTTGVQLV